MKKNKTQPPIFINNKEGEIQPNGQKPFCNTTSCPCCKDGHCTSEQGPCGG